ncbi:hypothetical protein [Paenibacillus sonchi]|uniref:hypothetical protein n=1 Tax=Paenibacillus sonchi TaxID=373687 RepID=UPI0005845EDF|nr:hypothetical protein [Paenibacillus sonchi]
MLPGQAGLRRSNNGNSAVVSGQVRLRRFNNGVFAVVSGASPPAAIQQRHFYRCFRGKPPGSDQ